MQGTDQVTKDLILLSNTPASYGKHFKLYDYAGYRFRTRLSESDLKTQNSGVLANFNIASFASTRDSRPVDGIIDHYGTVEDIIELDYCKGRKVVLFKCAWAGAVKKDSLGFTIVDFTTQRRRDIVEPMVLPSQVSQVFYVQDPESKWKVAVESSARDTYNMGGDEPINDEVLDLENHSYPLDTCPIIEDCGLHNSIE